MDCIEWWTCGCSRNTIRSGELETKDNDKDKKSKSVLEVTAIFSFSDYTTCTTVVVGQAAYIDQTFATLPLSATVADLNELRKKISEIGSDKILCVLSTTSCFAPRARDNVEEIAQICQKNNIGHVINNAYVRSKLKN